MTTRDRSAAAGVSGLRSGTIGVTGMVFMAVAATAPLTAMTSNLSLSIGFGVGGGTVGLLLLVGALLAVFAVGYLVLARYVTNAGAYYAFVEFGLGRAAGAAAAFVATLAYNLASAGMVAASGYFTALAVSSVTGIELPWYGYAVVALLVTYVLGIRGVELATLVTTTVSVLQFAIILVLGVAVLVQRPEGWSADVLSPGEVFGGNVALTLVFCLLSFAGFEASAVYGEEARAPRKSVRIATYSALALLLAVFTFSTWSIDAAFADARAVAATDPGALVPHTADLYLGPWTGTALSALVAISFLAAAVAFHNLATRYMFALGRAGLLPASLAGVSSRWGTPHVGVHVQVVVSVVLLGAFVLADADLFGTLFPAISGITSLSLVALMLGCCGSVIVAAVRGTVTEPRWQTIAAPSIAGAGLLVVLWVIATHYSLVTGSDALVIALMPAAPVLAGLYGALAARRGRRTSDVLELDA